MSEKEIEMSVHSTGFALLGARIAALFSLTLLTLLYSSGASAVPSFMRQTGLECGVCHTVYPQLTPFGREFKLRGYTLSTLKPDDAPLFDKIPIAGLLQVSRTATRNTGTGGATNDNFPRDRDTIIQAAGLYYAGKITDRSGALVQYNYDGIERKWAMEMFDARYADSMTLGRELVYGVTLNNSPTVSDIYNSTPMWAFPHTGSVSVMPNASTLVDMRLASQVGGVGVYGLWNNLLYAEFDVYRTANTGLMPVVHHAKFALRYTAYTQFNGAGGNYDGFGRNAKDNSSLFLLAWFLI
jgi:hypothetical protein